VCSRATCKHAGKPQPVSNFYSDKRSSDAFKSECADCANAEAERLGDRNRETADRKLAIARSSLIANTLKKPNSLSHMNALAEAFVGLNDHHTLAKDYLRLLDDPDLKPQHKIRLYQGLFNVMKDSDDQNPGRGDVSLMTDVELEEEIRRIVQQENNRDAVEVEYVEYSGSDEHSAVAAALDSAAG
jgi:hypothetical protein